ncbi:MAG: hypothetical protein KAT15_30295, partial [Bacteroidales bacterium]|nr:hypothetical protein [Bacteroidales bacterium]
EGSWGRYPMLWAISEDGVSFDRPMHVNGEVIRRYDGGSKNIGPCNYQRGLYENGADIPGDDVWVVYSMSKEDIWISRIPVPLKSSDSEYVNCNFNTSGTNTELNGWNIYHPRWAPVSVDEYPSASNKSLRFADKDPFDYAKAFKMFKESRDKVKIGFRFIAGQNDHGRFEVEVGNTQYLSPVKLVFNPSGEIQVAHWKGYKVLGKYVPDEWMNVEINIDVKTNSFNVRINDNASDELVFDSRKINYIDRLNFRTGINRGISINPVEPGEDLPLANEAVFYIDNVIVREVKD